MSVTRMCAVAVVAAVTVLSGCVPGGSSTPTGTPQVSVRSFVGCAEVGRVRRRASPAASRIRTEKQHRDQVEMDALYAEAEAVVRKGLTEDIRLQSDWRIAKVTPDFICPSCLACGSRWSVKRKSNPAGDGDD